MSGISIFSRLEAAETSIRQVETLLEDAGGRLAASKPQLDKKGSFHENTKLFCEDLTFRSSRAKYKSGPLAFFDNVVESFNTLFGDLQRVLTLFQVENSSNDERFQLSKSTFKSVKNLHVSMSELFNVLDKKSDPQVSSRIQEKMELMKCRAILQDKKRDLIVWKASQKFRLFLRKNHHQREEFPVQTGSVTEIDKKTMFVLRAQVCICIIAKEIEYLRNICSSRTMARTMEIFHDCLIIALQKYDGSTIHIDKSLSRYFVKVPTIEDAVGFAFLFMQLLVHAPWPASILSVVLPDGDQPFKAIRSGDIVEPVGLDISDPALSYRRYLRGIGDMKESSGGERSDLIGPLAQLSSRYFPSQCLQPDGEILFRGVRAGLGCDVGDFSIENGEPRGCVLTRASTLACVARGGEILFTDSAQANSASRLLSVALPLDKNIQTEKFHRKTIIHSIISKDQHKLLWFFGAKNNNHCSQNALWFENVVSPIVSFGRSTIRLLVDGNSDTAALILSEVVSDSLAKKSSKKRRLYSKMERLFELEREKEIKNMSAHDYSPLELACVVLEGCTRDSQLTLSTVASSWQVSKERSIEKGMSSFACDFFSSELADTLCTGWFNTRVLCAAPCVDVLHCVSKKIMTLLRQERRSEAKRLCFEWRLAEPFYWKDMHVLSGNACVVASFGPAHMTIFEWNNLAIVFGFWSLVVDVSVSFATEAIGARCAFEYIEQFINNQHSTCLSFPGDNTPTSLIISSCCPYLVAFRLPRVQYSVNLPSLQDMALYARVLLHIMSVHHKFGTAVGFICPDLVDIHEAHGITFPTGSHNYGLSILRSEKREQFLSYVPPEYVRENDSGAFIETWERALAERTDLKGDIWLFGKTILDLFTGPQTIMNWQSLCDVYKSRSVSFGSYYYSSTEYALELMGRARPLPFLNSVDSECSTADLAPCPTLDVNTVNSSTGSTQDPSVAEAFRGLCFADFVRQILRINPTERPSLQELQRHPFVADVPFRRDGGAVLFDKLGAIRERALPNCFMRVIKPGFSVCAPESSIFCSLSLGRDLRLLSGNVRESFTPDIQRAFKELDLE